MNHFWDFFTLNWNKKNKILFVSILFAIIVSSAFLSFFILTIPPQPGVSSISILNEDGQSSPLTTNAIINESITYLIEVENHENRIQYYVILILYGAKEHLRRSQ